MACKYSLCALQYGDSAKKVECEVIELKIHIVRTTGDVKPFSFYKVLHVELLEPQRKRERLEARSPLPSMKRIIVNI